MHLKYSKPSADIQLETAGYDEAHKEILNRQEKLGAFLSGQPERNKCVNCGEANANNQTFQHRSVKYFICGHCQHVQSLNMPPENYPFQNDVKVEFSNIYSDPGEKAYISRRDRIYLPKLEWVLESCDAINISRDELRNNQWLEIGAGAGYFQSALKQAGFDKLAAVECDVKLVDMANKYLQAEIVRASSLPVSEVIKTHVADVFVAFFVLEHIHDLAEFWEALSQLKKGTLFVFSVPVFSFSTILESAFSQHSARNLDNVLHTQLFTDASIAFGLKQAGFEPLSQWVFGQDASDFGRLLMQQLSVFYPSELLSQVGGKLSGLTDVIQSALDEQFFADARHVIAIKK